MHRFLCSVALWWIVALPAAGSEILPLSQIQPGMRGYGLSVFTGAKPARFDVEVLGTWKHVAPDTSFILARLSGMNLEKSGVVAGMSGSPVYIEDRLVGAVSFAWPFAIEPIAGITPIEAMRRLGEAPLGAVTGRSAMPPVGLRQLVSGRIAQDSLQQHLERLLPEPIAGARAGIGWSAVGFGPASRTTLAQGLGTVSPAGSTDLEVSTSLAAGGSIAAVLIDGDMRLAATGTLTERREDEILAFGHPFLSIGTLAIPMATTEVITVVSSQLNSFKIVNIGSVVGAFDLDRSSGLRGRVGAVAEMTPLTIEIAGDRQREFALEVARVPMLTPTLVAVSVMGALDSVTQAAGGQGLDLELRFDLANHEPLEIRQSFDGETAGIESVLYVLAFADYLMNNELEEVDIDGIAVTLVQHPAPRLATLVEAHASKTRVRPGESLSLHLDLTEFRGERRRAAMDLEIPTSIPDGRYSILVGDGVSIDVARLAIEQTAPVTFGQALDLLGSLHSRRQLVALGVFAGQGLAVAGEVMPQLPASVRSLWGAAASSSAVPLQLAIAQQLEQPMDRPIFGAARIDLEVRRDGPLGPEATVEPQDRDTSGGEGSDARGRQTAEEGSG